MKPGFDGSYWRVVKSTLLAETLSMNALMAGMILTIDAGGTHVKILATGEKTHREFPSGPTLTAKRMVAAVKKLAGGWKYDMVSIGYPGLVVHGRPVSEPHNLAPGWVGFNFAAAFKLPVKVINDAAMLCHQTTSWNDIKGIGFYKHH